MNYIQLLKSQKRNLLVSGPEGSGKSLLIDSLLLGSEIEQKEISVDDLFGTFQQWMVHEPDVIIIDVDVINTELLDKITTITSKNSITVNLKGFDPYELPTPVFIIESTWCMRSNKRWSVIELSLQQ